jgi:hypothetical protein
MELNCLVLGDDISRIFQVELAPTQSIPDLREEIKVKKNPAFNHVIADSIILWKVSVPIDKKLQHNIASLCLVEEDALKLPVEELTAIFSPVPYHLHVVIKPPRKPQRRFISMLVNCFHKNSPSAATILELNCWFIGEPSSSVFSVEIEATSSVGLLIEKIKGVKNAFKDVDLTLWNVSMESIITGTEFETKVGAHSLTEEVSLHPLSILSDVIFYLPAGRIHIVIEARGEYDVSYRGQSKN